MDKNYIGLTFDDLSVLGEAVMSGYFIETQDKMLSDDILIAKLNEWSSSGSSKSKQTILEEAHRISLIKACAMMIEENNKVLYMQLMKLGLLKE